MLFFCSFYSFGQNQTKDAIIQGNESFEKGNFDNAEVLYKKAIAKDPSSVKANYNLGNALYEQKRYKESITHYNKTAQLSSDKAEKHQAFHNMGNAYMQEKDYEKAMESFKSALKNNPYDEDTRRNFALAKKMLEKQEKDKNKDDKKKNQDPEKDNQDQQDKNNQKDQNKDKNEQNNNNNSDQKPQQQGDNPKQEKNNGNESNSGGEKGNAEGKGTKPDPQIKQGDDGSGMEQKNAQNNRGEGLLQALQNQEAKTQRKQIEKKAKKSRNNTSKDW